MTLLRQIADRLLPPTFEHPEPPVDAANSFPSMIYSADDEVQPSRRLLEIALEAVRLANEQVTLDDIAARPRVPEYFNTWPGEHYRLLGGMMLALKPQMVIEIGTFTGLSALAMKKYLPQGGRILTFDLQRWDLFEDTVLHVEDFEDLRLSQEVGDLAAPGVVEQHRKALEAAEFIFIDGPKDGHTEQAIMESFRNLRFAGRPVLMFDDTRLWSMLKFWRELPYPKLDLTSFGHWSGTGLVELP